MLFDVASMPDYGKLSGRSLDEMIAGARVEVAPYKRDPMDFVLWKPSKPGEPSWPSPAGIADAGAPGLAHRVLGHGRSLAVGGGEATLSKAGCEPHMFDIHGGGIDLVFPHHENEIAQSRCANGTPIMAQVWMHNGFLQVEGEKMAKSAGNFVTVHELLEGWQGMPGPARRFASTCSAPTTASRSTGPLIGLDEAQKTLVGVVRRSRRQGSPRARAYPAHVLDALLDDLIRRRRSPSCTSCTAPALEPSFVRRSASSASLATGRRSSRTCVRLGCEVAHGCRLSKARSRFGRRRECRAGGQELQGGRPHPRRARSHGHHAERRQGPQDRRARHHLGGRPMTFKQLAPHAEEHPQGASRSMSSNQAHPSRRRVPRLLRVRGQVAR